MVGSDNERCFVEMRMISGSGYTALHIGCTNGENIVTGCITSLETGIYNLNIFDINNNGQKNSSGKAVTISTVQVFQVFPPNQSRQMYLIQCIINSIREISVSCEYHTICHMVNLSVL